MWCCRVRCDNRWCDYVHQCIESECMLQASQQTDHLWPTITSRCHEGLNLQQYFYSVDQSAPPVIYYSSVIFNMLTFCDEMGRCTVWKASLLFSHKRTGQDLPGGGGGGGGSWRSLSATIVCCFFDILWQLHYCSSSHSLCVHLFINSSYPLVKNLLS